MTAASEAEADALAWNRLLGRLSDDHPQLVDDYLERLQRTGLYQGYSLSESDLRQSASEGIAMLIAQLGGAPLPERLRDLPARLGARRARQGVDRDALLEAVRLDFRVLWAGLVRAAGSEPDSVLVHHAEQVLSIVEQYIGAVHEAFLDERAALASDSRLEETRALSALFAADDVERVAEEVQHRLRFRPGAPLEVFCSGHAHAATLRKALAEQRRHVVTWEFEDATACIRERAGEPLPGAVTAVPCAHLDDVPRLADLPKAVELARRIARFVEDGDGPTGLESTWPAIVRAELAARVPAVLPDALGALDALPDGERERLLETLRWYWATGSIKHAAEQLFVHRNTVVNRLRAFADATGLDPAVPADAALAIIGLGPRLPSVWPSPPLG